MSKRYRVTIGYKNGRTQVINPGPAYTGNYKALVSTVAGSNEVKYAYQKKL